MLLDELKKKKNQQPRTAEPKPPTDVMWRPQQEAKQSSLGVFSALMAGRQRLYLF